MKISIQEIVQKTIDEELDNTTINNIPFREWIDNVNNACENKKCNFGSCRYNAEGECISEKDREACVNVARAVLCL
jgi:hypothetical protein